MEKTYTIFDLMQSEYEGKEAYLGIMLIDGTVYAEAEEVEHILETLYPNRKYAFLFYNPLRDESENLNNACEHFCLAFDYWRRRNATDFLKYHTAITAQYNPIENYDRKEDSEHSTETHFGHKETRDNSATTTPSGSTKNAEYVYGYDSTQANPKGYNETTFDSAQTEVSGHDTFVISDIDADTFDNAKDSTHSRIHGNVGVTTSATMVKEEIALRLKDFLVLMLTKFVSEYTYMCEGV